MEPQGIPFRTILENMAEAVLLCARPGCILHLNPAAERFLEQPRDRAIERSCFELFGDDPAGPRPDCPADLARGEGVGHLSLERTITTPSGKTKDVLLRCIPCSDANQPELSHILIIEDLTALKQSETSARETESRYRSFVENFLGIAYRSRMDWIPVFFHGSVEEITGYLERDFLEGRPRWDQVILPEDLESLEGRDELPAVPGYMVDRTYRILRKDGRVRWVRELARNVLDASGKPAFFQGAIYDVTERLAFDEQLRETQKFESMGLLAGGIAHDFNNLLMGVLGNADLALTMLSPENPAHDFVRTILDTGKKLADLTNQMLAFSGKGRFVVQPMDLNRIVRNLGDLLGMAVPKGVEIRYDLDPDLPRVEADASQLRQLVLNLVTNAGEAIGKLEGSIAVATGTVHASREFFRQTRLGKSLPEGEYVSFEVTDTGAGIEPDAMKKIFDPFFSTKFSGRGLGLAAVHGIVRSHNGAIRLESEPGQGSTFQVLFPPAARPASSTPVARKRGVFKGKGTVLVVDDEESVRSVAEKMLRNLGFDVLTAVDGVEGLETLRAHEPSITGVLLDLTMPRMDGKEAFVRIREILPDLPVLLMSGYNQQEVQARFAGAGLAGFLQKPFTLASLREILYAALDTPQ